MSTQNERTSSEFQRGFFGGLLAAAVVCLAVVVPAFQAGQQRQTKEQLEEQTRQFLRRDVRAWPLPTYPELREPKDPGLRLGKDDLWQKDPPIFEGDGA